MTLDREDIEAIARRVAQLLDTPPTGSLRYFDAAALAQTLGVEREWVYAHAAELGAIRLGGPHGRLRFDLDHVRHVLSGAGLDLQPRRLARARRARDRAGHGALDRRARTS